MHRIYQKHQPVLGNPQTRVGRVYIFAAMKKIPPRLNLEPLPLCPATSNPTCRNLADKKSGRSDESSASKAT